MHCHLILALENILCIARVTFVLGMVLIVCGWRMTGQMAGLGLMLVGVALILATLYLYNARFADRKKH